MIPNRAARTRVAEFDLASPAPVWGLEGYNRALILARNSGTPQALVSVEVPAGTKVLTVDEISRLLAAEVDLRAFLGSHSDERLYQPAITVVVCTRDRPIALRGCLDSLKSIAYDSFEVIVVDNASQRPETRELVLTMQFRYVREDRPGLNWARNRGVAEASHDIVAYTDDDVRVDPHWLRGVAKGFADPEVAFVTGLICPLELETTAQHLFEDYGGMGKGFQSKLFDPDRMTSHELLAMHDVGVGANMAYRRKVLQDLGGFDVNLEVGTPSGGAGDLDMLHRVLTAGYKGKYEPNALVWHQHRRSAEGLYRQIYNNGRSFGCYLLKVAAKRTVPRSSVVGFAVKFWIGAWLIVSFLRRRPGRTLRLVCAEWWGALHSPWAYVQTYRKLPWLRREG